MKQEDGLLGPQPGQGEGETLGMHAKQVQLLLLLYALYALHFATCHGTRRGQVAAVRRSSARLECQQCIPVCIRSTWTPLEHVWEGGEGPCKQHLSMRVWGREQLPALLCCLWELALGLQSAQCFAVGFPSRIAAVQWKIQLCSPDSAGLRVPSPCSSRDKVLISF